MSGQKYFSGAGGLMTTAETYAQFAMMLANGGALNGQRLLSPRTVELMGSAYIPSTLPGRPAGEGYGLGVRVVTDPVARGTWLTEGSFGWSGAYGTHFWSDPKKNLVGILMAQTSNRTFSADFENAVLQAGHRVARPVRRPAACRAVRVAASQPANSPASPVPEPTPSPAGSPYGTSVCTGECSLPLAPGAKTRRAVSAGDAPVAGGCRPPPRSTGR